MPRNATSTIDTEALSLTVLPGERAPQINLACDRASLKVLDLQLRSKSKVELELIGNAGDPLLYSPVVGDRAKGRHAGVH